MVRTRVDGSEMIGGHPLIETSDDMNNELRGQFLPTNKAWQEREVLLWTSRIC